jgi:hypothetical protein
MASEKSLKMTMTDTLALPVVTGDTPGSPNGQIAPIRGTPGMVTADPRRQYVAGSGLAWYTNYARSLPWAFDDLTTDFGDDYYERMLFDAVVNSCVTIYKASVLEEGVALSSAVDDKDADGYDKAKLMLEYCERVLDDIDPSMDDTLWGMLDACAYGNKVAELNWDDDRTYSGLQHLKLVSIKVKPRRSTAFVVDTYLNVLGLVARIPGIGVPVQTGTILAIADPGQLENLLPRSKFAVLTFRPKDNDPRGSSMLRAANTAWYNKMQTWPEYLKYLAQFASPGLIGFTPEGAESAPLLDGDGNVIGAGTSPEQLMVNTMAQWRNGAALAFAGGSAVTVVQSQGEGRAFLSAFAEYDRQIGKAILTQTLATGEGQHQARAAASVHQDVLTTLIRQGRRAVVRMLTRDVLRQMIRFNFGEQASLELTPKVSLGQVEQQDFSATANAIAALNKAGYLDPSQFPGVDTLLSLPARDPAALATPPPAQTPPAPNEQQPPSQTTQERNATQPTPPAA